MEDVKSIHREKGQRQQVNLTDKKEEVTKMSGVKGMQWGEKKTKNQKFFEKTKQANKRVKQFYKKETEMKRNKDAK